MDISDLIERIEAIGEESNQQTVKDMVLVLVGELLILEEPIE